MVQMIFARRAGAFSRSRGFETATVSFMQEVSSNIVAEVCTLLRPLELAELLTPDAFREPGKDRLYDSPYAIAVYFVVTIFALIFWIVEQIRIKKDKVQNGKNNKNT
jgi:hypothetical protein